MKRILIIEHDTKATRALAARLKALGYHPILSHDAVSGVVAATERPDLILLDIMMPFGMGVSVIDRLQEMPETAGIPFIATIESTRPDLRERAMALGAAGFFEGDCNTDELVGAISTILEDRAGAGQHVA